MSGDKKLAALLKRVRSCTHCTAHLPLGPNPVVHLGSSAKIMIIGQAPGTKVHKTGVPWNDPSGDNLRNWMGLSREEFYDESRIAIMPMGFCYPGKGKSGDMPPRPECAPKWHELIRTQLPDIRLTLLIGQYAHAYYLKDQRKNTLAETVQAWKEYKKQGFIPLVHPSPRNRLWLKKNPWFDKEIVPALRRQIKSALGT